MKFLPALVGNIVEKHCGFSSHHSAQVSQSCVNCDDLFVSAVLYQAVEAYFAWIEALHAKLPEKSYFLRISSH